MAKILAVTPDRRKENRREAVNHPSHYGGDVPHEVWKCLNAWGTDYLSAYLWTAVTYIARCDKKGSMLEDLQKARWYLDKEIELLEKRNGKSTDQGNDSTSTKRSMSKK